MLRVNGDRLLARLRELARIGATPDGGVQRLAFSADDVAARQIVAARMMEAGLHVRADAVGNTIGSSGQPGPSIVLGSHTDTVPNGGRFDGALGVVAAIECAQALGETGFATALNIVNFQAEECGVRGSRAWTGALREEEITEAHDAIRAVGGAPDRLDTARRLPGELRAYLELHIEQGPRLEDAGVQIGVVSGILGMRRLTVLLTGEAAHAGATPMARRRDALLAAAQLTVAVNETVRNPAGESVATVGRMTVEPNASNVIAGRVELSIDVRALDSAALAALVEELHACAGRIALETGVGIECSDLGGVPPVAADAAVMAAIEQAAAGLGLSHQRLISHAVHDASLVGQLAPMGMVFVPSVGGLSHTPHELTHDADCLNGANVLLNAARLLRAE